MSAAAARTRSAGRRVKARVGRLLGFRVRTILKRAYGFARRVWWKISLLNHRNNALVYWPEVRGVDRWASGVAMALLKYHEPGLRFVCEHAHKVRRIRRPRRLRGPAQRVLHVTCSFDLGGTQTQIRNLCGAPGSALTHDAVETFPELNYLFRRGVTLDRDRYVSGGVVARTLGRLTVCMSTRSAQLVQVYKLVRDFRAVRPDVVVGWGHETAMLTFVAAAIARVPRVVFCIRTFNPTEYHWTPPFMQRLLYSAHGRMQPLVDAVIVNSTPLQRDYAAWLDIDAARIAVCANGIDVAVRPPAEIAAARARIRGQFGIPADAVVILNVGRFSEEKGQMSIARADVELLRRYPRGGFYWLLCGDGPTLDGVRAFAAAQGLRNILFAGRTDEVPAFLSAADLFVMPSDFEGMPNAMMEAMAYGLACVSTSRSGAVDIARDGREALYYAPGDVDRLVEHVARLIDQPALRSGMGRAAAERIKEFSVSHSVETFERVLGAIR